MKLVYTWPLIYILLFFLPSQSNQPTSDLETFIGAPVLKAKISSEKKLTRRVGELVSYLGRYAIVGKESTSSPGYFDVITRLSPLRKEFLHIDDLIPLQPSKVLKNLTLVEQLSNN